MNPCAIDNENMCPVCGYPSLREPARDPQFFCPSDEICASCGIQFGYHDVLRSHQSLRDEWISQGKIWRGKATQKPDKWDADAQLRGLGANSSVDFIQMVERRSILENVNDCGRVWLRSALTEEDLHPLEQAYALEAKAGARLSQSGLAPTLAKLSSLLSARPVRIVAFNKSKGTNWGVPWHQDRVISVQARHEVEGFSNWSKKAGVWHCEPPLAMLEQILFTRVHLDDTDADSGAMEIARGSHVAGKVESTEAAAVAARYPHEACTAKRGDVLVLKMLTLHRSRPAKAATSRREVRIDFSSFSLPAPLSWAK